MKVNSTDYKNILQQYNEAKKLMTKESLNTDNKNKPNADMDKGNYLTRQADIQISEDYKIYEKSMKELFKMDNNDEKIRTLTAKIESGNYKIAPEEIAKSILEKCK